VIDTLIPEFDKALRAVFAAAPTRRPMPGEDLPEAAMSDDEKRHVAALMRVNHCGEICAQALYQGQALSSRDPVVKRELEQAAWEETEHLNWTERRIAELGGRKSLLNPLWYAGWIPGDRNVRRKMRRCLESGLSGRDRTSGRRAPRGSQGQPAGTGPQVMGSA
jgi:hypothetical protein